MDNITEKLTAHYTEKFLLHGPTAEGVDWGKNTKKIQDRYKAFVNAISFVDNTGETLLDIGCGYGAFIEYMKPLQDINYYGIDSSAPMIEYARTRYTTATFYNIDFFSFIEQEKKSYDHVIINGIFTQKLNASSMEMYCFMKKFIQYAFAICNISLHFNVMSTNVNYFSDNLYYKSPIELISFLFDMVSKKVVMDHTSLEHEYIVSVYK